MLFQSDSILVVSGKLSEKDDVIKLVVNDVQPIENALKSFAKGYKIWLNLDEQDLANLELIKKELLNTNGKTVKLRCFVSSNDKTVKKTYYSMETSMPLNNETARRLCEVFGSNRVQFEV